MSNVVAQTDKVATVCVLKFYMIYFPHSLRNFANIKRKNTNINLITFLRLNQNLLEELNYFISLLKWRTNSLTLWREATNYPSKIRD